MVRVIYDDKFVKIVLKIKDSLMKLKVQKQISKIIKNPEIGKPMRNVRKGTREVYVNPYRLSYKYYSGNDTLEFLEVYHKDEQ